MTADYYYKIPNSRDRREWRERLTRREEQVYVSLPVRDKDFYLLLHPDRRVEYEVMSPEERQHMQDSHRAKWTSPGWPVDPETGEPIDSGQYPLSPEKMEYARAFTRASDAYSATGDMTGLQELGISSPTSDA